LIIATVSVVDTSANTFSKIMSTSTAISECNTTSLSSNNNNSSNNNSNNNTNTPEIHNTEFYSLILQLYDKKLYKEDKIETFKELVNTITAISTRKKGNLNMI